MHSKTTITSGSATTLCPKCALALTELTISSHALAGVTNYLVDACLVNVGVILLCNVTTFEAYNNQISVKYVLFTVYKAYSQLFPHFILQMQCCWTALISSMEANLNHRMYYGYDSYNCSLPLQCLKYRLKLLKSLLW